ncbi:hypothetical protein Gpo141_00005696 [Globisporangium polare]
MDDSKSPARDDTVALDESSVRDDGIAAVAIPAISEPNEPTRQKRHNKRWEDDETLLFIQAWEQVLKNVRSSSVATDGAESKDESHLALSGRIFQLFSALQGGSTMRSEQAVNIKMTTLEMSFRFITKFNRALSLQGDSRDWFSLSKAEKREVKEANCLDNRMIDLSRTIYEALRTVVRCEVEKDAAAADNDSTSYPIDSDDDELGFINGGGVHYPNSHAPQSSQARPPNPEATETAVRAHKKRKLQQLEEAIGRQDAQVRELLAEIQQEREERKRESALKEQARQQREMERRREREEDREMMWALINELKRQNERTHTNW